jgi:hypothetical protein
MGLDELKLTPNDYLQCLGGVEAREQVESREDDATLIAEIKATLL